MALINQEHQDMELVVQQDGPVVQVTMNRPQALNALSLEMIRMLAAGLREWEQDDSVQAVFIEGAGDRAFCAGGDVKATYKTGMAYRRGAASENVISLFYGEEYCLNRHLFHFKKPLFAFMDGITMGGGFGIAGPCKYRIASEKTVFAMPETAIGFFPDVGSVYFLNRCPGGMGTYLALTGNSIGPSDTYYGGLATHYIPSARHQECQQALVASIKGGDEDIEDVLGRFHCSPEGEQPIQDHRDLIDRSFAQAENVEDVLQALHDNGNEWAVAQAEIIAGRSPTSLKISLAHMRKAANMDFDDIMGQDFILAQHFMKGHDFYEGVRALLVDKDKNPQWEPKTLEGVSKDMVASYFKSTGLELDEMAA